MGISFKVGKVGTRYRPRPVQDEVQENDNGGAVLVADTQSRKRLSTDKVSGKGDKVADRANVCVKSAKHLASEDMEASFSLNLFTNGFFVGKATEHFNGVPKQLYPYDRASNALLTAIEYGWLPGDIFGNISCNYNNGAVLCEIRDYRHCSYEKSGITCMVNSPVVHKVLLQMCMENVIRDILSASDDSWTYKDLLEVESCLLKALQPDLRLNPEPLLDKFCGAPMTKKLDLGIKWGWKKRKLNGAPASNPRFSSQNPRGVSCLQLTVTSSIPNAPATNPGFGSENQRVVPCSQSTVTSSIPTAPATNPRFGSQNQIGVPCSQLTVTRSITDAPGANSRFGSQNQRVAPCSQPIVTSSIPQLEENSGLLESIVQHPLTLVPSYQSVDSCSQSVLEDLTSPSYSSVTTECFGKHNNESREPNSLFFSQQCRSDAQAVQGPILKMPKQEAVEFSEQLPPWNKCSSLATVPSYQLVDSCSPVLGDLASSSLYSVPTQCFSKSNWETREPDALFHSPLGGCELQAVQRPITKMPKQEPVDFSQQLPPCSQPNPLAMVPNYQLAGSCGQSVVGDLTSSSLSLVPTQCFSNSDSIEPSSFALSDPGRFPGSQPNALAMVPVLRDLTSSNLSSVSLQCFSNSKLRDPSSLVHSQMCGRELQAIQRPGFKIPKQEIMDFSPEQYPVNQPNPLAMAPNYQLVDNSSQSVLGDKNSSSLSSLTLQYFSKRNGESRDPSSFVHFQLGRFEMEAVQRPVLKIPKQETVDFSYQQPPGSQPHPLALVPNCQLADSYNQSVVGDFTSSSFASVPMQGFSNRSSWSREPSSLVHSQPGRCELPAIQRSITKMPKQEPVDFSQQQLPGSQPEFIFASGMQQNPMLHQQAGVKKVPGEKFQDKRGQSQLISGRQLAILEGIPKLQAGTSTSTVRQEPAETRNFSSLDATRIKDRYLDMDTGSNRSNLQQLQLQGSSQMLGTYAPPINSPWNQLPNDRIVRKEVVTQKRKALQSPQITAEIAPPSSYQSESVQREASVPAKRKKICRPRGSNTEISDSLGVAGNTNAIVPRSLKFGNGHNSNESVASSLQVGNSYNSNAIAGNLQAGNSFKSNEIAASRLQVGNRYAAVLSSVQAGNGYNSNTAEGSLPAGNSFKSNEIAVNSDQVGNSYNSNATVVSSIQAGNSYNSNAIAGSLQVGNSFKGYEIAADTPQVGNGYKWNATVVSSVQAGNGYKSKAIAGNLQVGNSYNGNEIAAGNLQVGNGYNSNSTVVSQAHGYNSSTIAGSLQVGSNYNSNEIAAGSFLVGNSYNSNATIASSDQAGNGYNSNAIAGSLQVGNSYNSNAIATHSLQAGNGDNSNAAVASSLQAGNVCKTNATIEGSLQVGNSYNSNEIPAGSLQVGNGCNLNATVASSLQAENGYSTNGTIDGILRLGKDYDTNSNNGTDLEFGDFNLPQTSEVGDIQRLEKIKEVTQRYELNDRKHKFYNSAPVIFTLQNSESWKLKDASTAITDRRFGVVKTRTLTFMRQSHLHQGNEIPIVDSKARVKLVMSKKFTAGFPEATVFYEHEDGIGPTVIPIPPTLPHMHFLDQFAAQFTSLMAREGYCLVSDHIQPSLLNDDNSSSSLNGAITADVPPVAIALGMIPGSTPVLSTSLLTPVSDDISASNNCRRLPPKNLNSGSRLLPPENIQTAKQNHGNNLLKLALDNSAAQMSPEKKPQWQQTLYNQAQLQLQMMQRQRQQDQLMQSMKMMGGVSTAVGGLGAVNPGGGIQVGHRNSGHGSAHTPMQGQIPSAKNVGQFNNIGSSNMPSSSDGKQQLFVGISDNVAAVLAEPRTANGGQRRTGGIPFWSNSGPVQMQTPNIQDMAYLLSNQQITPRNHHQQQKMRSVVKQQIKSNNSANNGTSPPSRASPKQFYQQPQMSPLQQLNCGFARMQQMSGNIAFGPESPELSSRTHVSISSSSASSSKNLSGFLKTRER